VFKLKESDVEIEIKSEESKVLPIWKYIRWDMIAMLIAIIIIGNFAKEYTNDIKSFIDNNGFSIIVASAFGFVGAFILGSSSRFAAIVAILTSIFGIQYLLWFFVIEFVAYLLSPTHKCMYIGQSYFGTPFKTYYSYVVMLSTMLVVVAALFTFL